MTTAWRDESGRGRPNVLVIDDDPSVLEAITDLLVEYGLNATGVPAADIALSRLETRPLPDCIVLDLSLPRLSGADFLRHVRCDASLKNIPVVVVTAWPSVGEMDADAILPKPFDIDALLSVLRRLISHGRGRAA